MAGFAFHRRSALAQMNLRPSQAELAALHFQCAIVRLALALKQNFNPDQPRIPAGNPQGGQWSGGNDNYRQVAAGGDGPRSVDLADEEGRGGHAIAEHVGKSANYLLARINQDVKIETPLATFQVTPRRAGSFSSLEAANKLINSTISQNSFTVTLVRAGFPGNQLITAEFASQTGIEAYRPSPNAAARLRNTYGVGVVIRSDSGSPRGYRVITAYPRNDRGAAMEFPKELNSVLAGFHQDFLRFGSSEEDILGALSRIDGRSRNAVKNFIDTLLSQPLDLEELQRLWQKSPAEIQLADMNQIPDMLRFIRALIDDPRLQWTA